MLTTVAIRDSILQQSLFNAFQHCDCQLTSTFTTMRKRMRLNWSAHSDTQQQVAAARQLLRAGGLQR